ncbi:plasmid mobilization protein [Nostoc piscinale]|nr:DUF1778 domain-containing protein [Nostoc piscinale]
MEKREALIKLRVNPQEHQLIKQAAQSQGLTISSYVRQNVGLPKLGS